MMLSCKSSNNNMIDLFLEKSIKELSNFFCININTPKVILLKSRKEIDYLKGEKTENYLVGWAEMLNFKKNYIFILDIKSFEKESNHVANDFYSTLKHELSHLYYNNFTHTIYPLWLNGGLADYLSNNSRPILKDKNQYLKIFDFFDASDKNIYEVSYSAVYLLIDRFGILKMKKLLDLIRDFNISNNKMDINSFSLLFKKNYNMDFDRDGILSMIN